jgi:hypothetical protein
MRRALLVAFALTAVACTAADDDDDKASVQEGELGAEPRAAGIAEGSLDEEGVLVAVDDPKTTASELETRAKLPSGVAAAITDFRAGGARFFESIDEIDALPGTDAEAFRKLATYARDTGATEAAGFDALDKVRMKIRDGHTARPTSADIEIEAAFDGRSPDEVRSLVRRRLRGTIHMSNERFVDTTIEGTLHAFTIAANNLFADGSPHARFARGLEADRLTLVGTMSAVNPTFLVAEKAGATRWYVRTSGEYVAVAAPKYPVVMRARIRLGGAEVAPGIRVFYPSWKAKVLAGPTGEVIEGGG